MTLDFCRNWTFCKEGETPVTVDLPHDAMLLEKRDGGCRNGVNSGYFPGGKYAYGKTFELDAAMPGKPVALHFEGVYQNCKVYVNGKLAGSHRYGYTAFDVDISDFAESGENNIRVEVDNSLEPNCRWYSGSGIYRPVHLLIREQNHISQVHMETVQIHPAKVRVDVKTTQDSDITVDIYEGEKRVASGKPGILEVPEAKLWSAEKPFLYKILVRTDTDERVIAFGIRKLEWNAEKGLTVNGQRVLLRGGCIHHDHGVLGACEFRDAEERRIRILKENGFNAVRIAHNPASQITLETCDKLGMYVLNETFDGWYIPKTYHDYARWFSEDWKQDVTAMVESARNHPMVTVTACVRNISSCYSGKDVVQLYLAKPEGKLHKEHKALAAFRKTGLLAPGQEEICTLQIDLQECASYDEETACKLLEQGEYGVFIGSDSRKNALCAVLTLEKTVVTEKLTNILPISKEFELFVPQTKALVYPAEVQHLTIQMGAFAKKGIHYDAPIPVIKTKQTGEYLKTLSDKELIELCVGAGFNGLGYNVTPTTVGRTSINLLKKGIPNVNFSDGPAGLNLCPKNAYTKFGVPNYVDELPQDWQWGWIRKIEPFVLAKPGKGYRVYQYMTCFPAATLQAQTWNPSLIEEVGHAIGTEMIEAGVTLWLAPGLNIHRNPLCGRNFEYYSEDPYVSGVMAASVTRGVQSHPGLGVTIKHFCCNNQEDKRETISENVPERALREIYLRGFEIAVRKSKPWAVMTSYNLVNGVHTFASNDLCTKALRNEWEYQGLVMTDWTASEKNPGEHTSCILAGNDLIMPGHPGAKKELTAALKSGQIKRSELEVAAANVLNIIFSSNVWSINE